MHCSLLSRNGYLISGVVISHLFILLGLLAGSLGEEKSSISGVLTVNMVGVQAGSLTPEKISVMPQKTSFSSKEIQSSIQADEASAFTGVGGSGHSGRAVPRQAIYGPKPHYPLASKKLREQGLVIVRLCVNERGTVDEAGISKSSGFLNLDDSALKALAQWRFAPAALNSASLSSQCFQTPIQFSLEG